MHSTSEGDETTYTKSTQIPIPS